MGIQAIVTMKRKETRIINLGVVIGGLLLFQMSVYLSMWTNLRTSDSSWEDLVSSRLGIPPLRQGNFNFFISLLER